MVEVQARTVLWYWVFVGFSINYLVCINLNIAIVEMIAPSHTVDETLPQDKHVTARDNVPSTANALLNPTTSKLKQTAFLGLNILNSSSVKSNDHDKSENFEELNLDSLKRTTNKIPLNSNQFHWNEHEQAMALGALFWTYCLSQIPGGILAKKYGTKLIFGLSNVIGCWICFFIPMAAKVDLQILVILRILQGLLTVIFQLILGGFKTTIGSNGLSWPAMHNMTAKWIPPNERSKFVTAYYGCSVGVAVFYPLFAYVMHFSSWEWVFHLSGVFGTIWWFGWLYYVYDTPAQHPRISPTELAYIEKPLRSMVQNANVTKTPWGAILTSSSVWMNVIGHVGGGWGLYTLMTQTPTYFKVVHNWDIRATGIFSGLPHLMRVIFAFLFSLYADYLLRTDKMSRTNVRKLATGISLVVNGIFVVALAYLGSNRILAITLITLTTMLQGSGSSGPLSSMIDIAPNYAGIILGICGLFGCMPGFMSPYVVGMLTLNNQTFEAWSNVFLICAGVLIGTGALYICFADSTLKPWNDYSLDKDEDKKVQLVMKDIECCGGTNTNLKE